MKIRGVNYHVECYSDGTPLVMLHGFTGSVENWYPFIKELSGFRLILIDIIGHGKTESPILKERYKMEEAVEDIKSILHYLNIEKANFLGYSMGGRLALSFAAAYPEMVEKLILESSSPGLKTVEEQKLRQHNDEGLANDILNKGLIEFVNRWENISLFETQKKLPHSMRESIREQRLKNCVQGLANSLLGMGTGAQSSLWEKLSFMQTPVLLLCGEFDQKFCKMALEMKKKLPYSIYKEINDAGHTIHVEQPRIFGKIIREFLN
ncbi:2-succinyl-6-hydroxy-2,4-cyclohexadiene-1-carboxylate synthase [Metabacillus fastidiosus]|uniref:2-succinyl-6-hydroxy-2, 4-cyclohexadiene-1-carboxylate synthase n=1 Tax=Metabacillus fastidiosus TaxID=1458 RepID=UPI002E1E0759|nr:2-succinyl-6-hydroxy-2,4-cyclohexadiene-1-carboxylate synthase [Metabacillus fastidiosus]MED4533548.1 2-succinyl-6-hydroxy-2,4-cyclohexadiene-1-carboxylate synthase [Metabacillus fastidiosus]